MKLRPRKLRVYQVSLRTIFAVTTLVCIGLAFWAWRQARDRYCEQLVARYNSALDDLRTDDAEKLAREALATFPSQHQVLAECMLEKAQFAGKLVRGEEVEFEFSCADPQAAPSP